MLLLLALALPAPSVALFQLLGGVSRGPSAPPGTKQLALYPLPAVYLPGSQCTVRNIEPRNIAMCREQTHFVSTCTDRGISCASIGSVLKIDDVRPAVRDTSGRVLAAAESDRVLEVRCTVVGRVRLVACQNLEAWTRPEKDQYLVADVMPYEDDHESGGDSKALVGEQVVHTTGQQGVAPAGSREEEAWWTGASAAGDVANAIYRLVDALLESSNAEGIDGGVDVAAAVGSGGGHHRQPSP